jgi:hypothetical protein
VSEYQIQAHTRRCAATGRSLRAGERYYSVLLDQGGKLVRLDYASEAWPGPPREAFGFWTGRVPAEDSRAITHVDDDMLVDYFLRLDADNDPAQARFRYVVALLLMRRRKFKFEEAVMEEGTEVLTVRSVGTHNLYRVTNPRLTEDEMATVQDEIFKLLGWHHQPPALQGRSAGDDFVMAPSLGAGAETHFSHAPRNE